MVLMNNVENISSGDNYIFESSESDFAETVIEKSNNKFNVRTEIKIIMYMFFKLNILFYRYFCNRCRIFQI